MMATALWAESGKEHAPRSEGPWPYPQWEEGFWPAGEPQGGLLSASAPRCPSGSSSSQGPWWAQGRKRRGPCPCWGLLGLSVSGEKVLND